MEFPGKAASFGSRGVIVHGASVEKNGLKSSLVPLLKKAGVETAWFCRGKAHPHALQEASVQEIRDVIALGKNTNARWIAGIGGGSVLDLAKAAAGLYHAHKDPVYYQEGGKLTEKGIPFLAVPTTAGSGSEATLNSVIINPVKKMKLSIRHPAFLASLVILDPVLLKSLPREVIVHSGMDAFVQAYESYISKNASLFTETLALRAIEMIASRLPGAARTKNEDALHEMLFASFLTGIAFSHSRLGVIHGIAHPLGVLYDIPHGLVCSACLIPSIKLNR
ncbi:MAG TPA: iron-containing alcohol dehydrogenase, partial [Candidatus Omnitrophota bacterium]|nr:iron-containing alcohol dehydrogenase [Candidatus Omnitrophota bacterium]